MTKAGALRSAPSGDASDAPILPGDAGHPPPSSRRRGRVPGASDVRAILGESRDPDKVHHVGAALARRAPVLVGHRGDARAAPSPGRRTSARRASARERCTFPSAVAGSVVARMPPVAGGRRAA